MEMSYTLAVTLFGYAVLWFFGRVKALIYFSQRRTSKGYAPLQTDLEEFVTSRVLAPLKDCYARPIVSPASTWIDVLEREVVDSRCISKGRTRRCFNFGSFNYLGFGDPESPCRDEVIKVAVHYSSHTCSNRQHLGTTRVHIELEETVARFIGKEAAMCFGMGYGTNWAGIPAIIGRGCLIISDTQNHASIANGARTSGAAIKTFQHNDAQDLERVIRKSILEGMDSKRPWKKILIIVEGIYSMEGTLCPLEELIRIKKKYKCYLYIDEAHSIGAVGPRGRGVCDMKGIPPADVDILMGTFSKSFGSMGGYIAGPRDLIERMKLYSAGWIHSPSMSPAAAQGVMSVMKCIMGEDGTTIGRAKLVSLHRNALYVRDRLISMGCEVLADAGSPVIPVMLSMPGAVCAFSRLTFERNIAVVVVGYPATPKFQSRIRFCVSAGHTLEELKIALDRVEEVVDLCGLRYMRGWCQGWKHNKTSPEPNLKIIEMKSKEPRISENGKVPTKTTEEVRKKRK